MKQILQQTIIVVLIISIVYLIIMLIKEKNNVKYKYEYKKIEVPVEVEKVEKVEIPVEKIKIIPKEKIKEKYIPVEIKNDNKKEIVAVGTVNCPEDSKVTVTAAFNKDTKETELYSKIERKQSLKFLNGGRVGVKYGLIPGEDFIFSHQVTAYSGYNVISFGDVNVGVGAELGFGHFRYWAVSAFAEIKF